MDSTNQTGIGQTLREATYGEQAVGITFNPANDPTVQKIKELYAEIIDICDGERSKIETKPSEKARLLSVAITEAQTAQMWAVKGVTYRS